MAPTATTGVDLGDRVKDKISGLEGIVVGITDWLHMCRTIVVRPEALHEGKPLDAAYIDEPQLEILVKGVHKPVVTYEPVGGKVARRITGGPERPAQRSQRAP